MNDYKLLWEVNQYRPDEFSDLTDRWTHYISASSRKEAQELGFINVTHEMGGGRLLSTLKT